MQTPDDNPAPFSEGVLERVHSNDVPPEYHQSRVHHYAKRYLQALVDGDSSGLERLELNLNEDLLFGLEVTDEALVLFKNDPSSWPVPLMSQMLLASRWDNYYKTVVQLRAGLDRQTTTPTLRRGGKRDSPRTHPSGGPGIKIPIVFGLKQLYLRFHLDQIGSPKEFSRSASLMQGYEEIPPIDDVGLASFLEQSSDAPLPDQAKLDLHKSLMGDWPEDTIYSFIGISWFSSGGSNAPKACAQHALKLNPECKLARQLARLLCAKTDVRCPMGVDAPYPYIPAILAEESAST